MAEMRNDFVALHDSRNWTESERQKLNDLYIFFEMCVMYIINGPAGGMAVAYQRYHLGFRSILNFQPFMMNIHTWKMQNTI